MMKYEGWEREVPEVIKEDSLCKMFPYLTPNSSSRFTFHVSRRSRFSKAKLRRRFFAKSSRYGIEPFANGDQTGIGRAAI